MVLLRDTTNGSLKPIFHVPIYTYPKQVVTFQSRNIIVWEECSYDKHFTQLSEHIHPTGLDTLPKRTILRSETWIYFINILIVCFYFILNMVPISILCICSLEINNKSTKVEWSYSQQSTICVHHSYECLHEFDCNIEKSCHLAPYFYHA